MRRTAFPARKQAPAYPGPGYPDSVGHLLELEARNLASFSDSPISLLAGLTTTASTASIALPRSGPRVFGQNPTGPGTVSNARSLMGIDRFASDPRFSGIDGHGFSTVILDTGINLSHSFFGPDNDHNGVDDRIVYQYDFADNDPSAADVEGHGSNVASIAASSDPTYRGVAPAAGIIALKVFSDSGAGNFGSIERALQWTISHAAQYNIASVNMSLGDDGNYSTAQQRYGIADELATLASMNVIVVSAAGNSFAENGGAMGLSYPAADPNSLAVGAVYSADYGGFSYGGGATATATGPDRIAPFSQRTTSLPMIFAAGAPVTGASASSGTITMHGTSQASPQIAGVAVLAQELAVQAIGRRLTPAEFRSILITSGTTIIDGDDENDSVPNTGASFKRVDMLALGNAILNMVPPPAPPQNVAPTLTHMLTLLGGRPNRPGGIPYALLRAAGDEADANGDLIRFRVTSVDSGLLFCNGKLVLAGRTLVGPGDRLIWVPPRNVTGVVQAFSVKAFDGFANSAASVPVNVNIEARLAFASRTHGRDQDLTASPTSPMAVGVASVPRLLAAPGGGGSSLGSQGVGYRWSASAASLDLTIQMRVVAQEIMGT